VGGVFWLGILLGLTFSDYATRAQNRSHREQSYAPSAHQGEIPAMWKVKWQEKADALAINAC
jgi:hypothetical protein